MTKGLSNSQRAFKGTSQGVKYLSNHLKHYNASVSLQITKATFNVVKATLWTTFQVIQFALDAKVQKLIKGDI